MCCVVGVLYIGIGYIKDRTRIGLFTLNFLREKIYDVVVVKSTTYDKSGYVITQVHEISLDAAKIQYVVKFGELGI